MRETVPPVHDHRNQAHCPYCGRSFASHRLETLHRGERHSGSLDDDEWSAVDDARQAERAELRRLRLRMTLLLVCFYFGFVVVYGLVRVLGG